jgi:hypothetical protein
MARRRFNRFDAADVDKPGRNKRQDRGNLRNSPNSDRSWICRYEPIRSACTRDWLRDFDLHRARNPVTRRIDRGRRRRRPGKAKRRLSQFVAHAGVLVLATHSEDVIREMCNKAVLMEHGRVASAGSLGEVLIGANISDGAAAASTVMFSLKATR